jgi:nitrite reductase/ring-hydroxylating ferredoxin subunit
MIDTILYYCLDFGVHYTSPLYKQHFNLQTGVCLEDETVTIPAYPVRIENGSVQVSIKE